MEPTVAYYPSRLSLSALVEISAYHNDLLTGFDQVTNSVLKADAMRFVQVVAPLTCISVVGCSGQKLSATHSERHS